MKAKLDHDKLCRAADLIIEQIRMQGNDNGTERNVVTKIPLAPHGPFTRNELDEACDFLFRLGVVGRPDPDPGSTESLT